MLETLQDELKSAMKARDKAKIMGIRNIIGKLKASQIDRGEALTAGESMKLLQSSAKQLKESIEQYEKGGRNDLAEIEKFELSLLEKYLPEQLSEENIRETVKNTIQTTSAESAKDMGKIMGFLKSNHAANIDMGLAGKIAKYLLGK